MSEPRTTPDHREDGVDFTAAVRDFLVFAVAVGLAAVFWKNNLLLAAMLVAVYLIRSIFCHRLGDHAAFALGALCCSAVEVLGTGLGAWTYDLPSFLNIPLWLPFAWGLTIVLAIRVFMNLSGQKYRAPSAPPSIPASEPEPAKPVEIAGREK